MKLYNRKQLAEIFTQNAPLYAKEFRFFYVDTGIVPFKDKTSLRQFIMTQLAIKCIIQGDR